MKFSEYLNEAKKEINLIGKTINGKLVTPETPNEIWEGDFKCDNKKLTSLIGAPKEVTGDFICDYNNLTTLVGAPEKVNGSFHCSINKITSLKGAPKIVGGTFSCGGNELTSLEGVPKEIGGYLNINNNKITSFKDIHKIITKINGEIYCEGNQIKSHVIGLLLIQGVKKIYSAEKWDKILNRHVGKGRARVIDCQNELIDAGYEEYAQL